VPPSSPAAGIYVSCDDRSARLGYEADIFARPATHMGMASLGRQVATVLRASGWRVAFVDLRKQHSPFPTVPHPAYQMTGHGLDGVINVLPARRSGSQALIFVESPCFDPGPIAKALEHETVRG